jgi:hypothetical protein
MTDEEFAQIKKHNDERQKQWEIEWLSWSEKAKEPLSEFMLNLPNKPLSEEYLEFLFCREVEILSRIYGNPPEFRLEITCDNGQINFNVYNKVIISEFEKSIKKQCKER